ncbi:MAG: 2Fe-2S iron-sulfur cluster-binding protein [Pseudanabaenaceae cyanobacterium bins.68]|nr:2Fe-2S iron-sulfur cluster-binding protein [Pseudanabaenaceae cyanobacterium bins.68]
MADTHTTIIHHRGTTYNLAVAEDQSVLEVAQAQGIDLPSSCLAGVCTSCAAQLVSGTVDQSQGMGMGGMGEALDAQGYVLLCVSYPRSDLEIITDKEEEVYAVRFGRQS